MFCRCIYARYAHGLLLDGGKLFNKIAGVAIVFFSLQLILMWPVRYELSKSSYNNIIKGRICTQSHIPEFLEEKVNIKFSVKPKLTSIAIMMMFLLSSLYFYKSAKRQTKRYKIPTHRRNLMDIKGNLMVVTLIAVNLIADQLINIPLEVFYSQLGAGGVFKVWWIWHLIMFVQIYILAPAMIICTAQREFLEFNGLKGTTFPGQEKPRPLSVVPHRGEIENGLGVIKKTHKRRIKTSIKFMTVDLQVHKQPQNRKPCTSTSYLTSIEV